MRLAAITALRFALGVTIVCAGLVIVLLLWAVERFRPVPLDGDDY